MFRIGVFSRLSQVSVIALRYYDEIGVLKPHHVDRFTGYRYYSVDQLPRLNRILALKDLGLTLDQIALLLERTLSATELGGMLTLKRAEIQQCMAQERELLARIEARLSLIKQEDYMPDYDVVVKSVDKQTVLSGYELVPSPSVETIGQSCRRICEQACRLMDHQGLKEDGPWTLIYDFEESPLGEAPQDSLRIEMAIPVRVQTGRSVRLRDKSGIALGELPALATAASTVHHGPYEMLAHAYMALGRWIEGNGYRIAGTCREIYLHGPEDPVTELQFPVEKGAVDE